MSGHEVVVIFLMKKKSILWRTKPNGNFYFFDCFESVLVRVKHVVVLHEIKYRVGGACIYLFIFNLIVCFF